MQIGENILEATKKVIYDPKPSFEALMLNTDLKITKKHLLFTVVMNVYYLLVPSTLIAVHIFAPVFFAIGLGVMYYFADEAATIYQEQKMDGVDDDKFLYKVAFCFALANVPALVLSVFNNIAAFVFANDFFVGLLIAFVLNIVWLVFAVFYPLKMLSVITRRKGNFMTLIKLIFVASIVCLKDWLGFKTLKIIYEDYKELS